MCAYEEAAKQGLKLPNRPRMLVEMLLFVLILVLGLAYAWAKGALEWQ